MWQIGSVELAERSSNRMSLSRILAKYKMGAKEWKYACCLLVVLLLLHTMNISVPLLTSLAGRDIDDTSAVTCAPCHVANNNDVALRSASQHNMDVAAAAMEDEDQDITQDAENGDELLNIRLNWLYPPGTGFNGKIRDYSQVQQAPFVDELLEHKKHGFFVECGAENGQKFSNSIFFETQRNWTGLLIEARKKLFDELLPRNRNAYSINACLSPTKNSGLFEWSVVNNNAALRETHVFSQARDRPPEGYMQCFPFGTMMAALNVNRVDYFSLDIEGGEIPVLKTIPWNDVYIDIIGIEYRLIILSNFATYTVNF